jgi:hypothetical protein
MQKIQYQWQWAVLSTCIVGTALDLRAESPTTNHAKRSWEEISADIGTVEKAISDIEPTRAYLVDAKRRAEVAPRMIPLLRQRVKLLEEDARNNPRLAPKINKLIHQTQATLMTLGDKQAAEALEKDSTSADKAVALNATLQIHFSRWLSAGRENEAQLAVIQSLEAMLKRDAANDEICALLEACKTSPTANASLASRIDDIIINDAKGEFGAKLGVVLRETRRLAAPASGKKRSVKEIQAELDVVERKILMFQMRSRESLYDAKERDTLKPTIIPLLKQNLELLDESATANPDDILFCAMRAHGTRGLLMMFGDRDAEAALKQALTSNYRGEVVEATLAIAHCQWRTGGKNEKSHAKIVDACEQELRRNPADQRFALALLKDAPQAATPELGRRMCDVVEKYSNSARMKQEARSVREMIQPID